MATPSLLIIPDRYKAAKLYSQLPESGAGDFTVTRGTTATRVNASGLIESVASGVPRIDYTGGGCGSLLVEPAATNQIRNNTMAGAVAGVIGSGGSWPTNWATVVGGGLGNEIIGTGVENGVEYIDVRVFGTASGTSHLFRMEATNLISATTLQTWANSSYVKLIAAPQPPSSYEISTIYTQGTSYLSQSNTSFTPTSSLIRVIATHTTPATLVNSVYPSFRFLITIGQSYDFTIRIGLPQMELGAVATSVIKTSTVAVTRNADLISLSSVSGLIGQASGSVYVECNIRTTVATASARRPISLEAATDTNSLIINIAIDGVIQTVLGGVTRTTGLNTSTTNGNVKIAIGYSASGFVTYVNGVLRDTYTGAWTQPTWNNVGLGNSVNTAGRQFNDRISAAAIYTTRLSNSELAQLTTL